jgi:ketosteroid isomerase-like protein
MLEKATVAAWLEAYVQAWKSYDPQAIGNLFSEDIAYQYTPFAEPVRGREAVVAAWLEDRDQPGTYDGHYEPELIEGDRAVTRGQSLYFEPDRKTLKAEWSNVFFLRFDEAGRCREYTEWFMSNPLKGEV